MNTLIVYAGKYDCTKDCSHKLKKLLNNQVIIADIKSGVPDLNSFDNIIIGSSIYMGQADKKLKAFISKNISVLLSKKIGLFLVCGFTDKHIETVNNVFPAELIKHAASVECFGGEIRKEKMGFMHKKIVDVLEKEVDLSAIHLIPENISKMASVFN